VVNTNVQQYDNEDVFNFDATDAYSKALGDVAGSFLTQDAKSTTRGKKLQKTPNEVLTYVAAMEKRTQAFEEKAKKAVKKGAAQTKKTDKVAAEKKEIKDLEAQLKHLQAAAEARKQEYDNRWVSGPYCFCKLGTHANRNNLVQCTDPTPACPGRGYYCKGHEGPGGTPNQYSQGWMCRYCDLHAKDWEEALDAVDEPLSTCAGAPKKTRTTAKTRIRKKPKTAEKQKKTDKKKQGSNDKANTSKAKGNDKQPVKIKAPSKRKALATTKAKRKASTMTNKSSTSSKRRKSSIGRLTLHVTELI